MSEKILIDWSVARQTVQDDEELLQELVSTFLEEGPRLLAAIRTAIDENDAKSIQRAAHTLKGALGHFGAHHAYDAALELETIGRESAMGAAPESLQSLDQAMAELTPVLLDYVSGGGAARGDDAAG